MSNDPNPEMDDFLSKYRRREEQRQRHAEEMARYLSGALRFLGVNEVSAAFDGYGDDGSLEELVFDPVPEVPLPPGLDNQVESMFGDLLPGGWEINAGSFGDIHLDVATAKVAVDIEWRDDDEDPESDEEEME